MADLDDQLDDLLADDRITLADAGEVQTFADFLRDAPRPPLSHESEPGFQGPLLIERVDFQDKWGGYMRGESDAPKEPSDG